MSEAIVLNAEGRSEKGTAASRRMRRLDDRVPGIVYGGGEDPVTLSVKANELRNAMSVEAFFSQILTLNVNGDSNQVIVRELQRHPAGEQVTHIDFLRVRADQAVQVSVPLHYLNEESCVGVKMGGGRITHNLVEVEVSCLPAQLPEFIEVDMAEVEVSTSVHLTDLVLPEGVQIAAFLHGDPAEHDLAVATVQAPRGGASASDDGDEAAGESADGEADEG